MGLYGPVDFSYAEAPVEDMARRVESDATWA